MASPFDLHTHSTASDGTLTPTDLVIRAGAKGIRVLALTDHDTTAGVEEAQKAALERGTSLIPGVEISVTWNKRLFHVVGLNIDANHPDLAAGLARLHSIREERAEAIGRRLAKMGIGNACDGARGLAGTGQVTRSHFARLLVQRGYAKDFKTAFKRALARGQPGYVATDWAELDEAVGWIRASGGVAVLAHPLRYRLSHAWIQRMLRAFKDAGGTGLEVACGGNTQGDTRTSAEYAVRFGLLGSIGSDYHGADGPHGRLGHMADLPPNIQPIWHAWDGSRNARSST